MGSSSRGESNRPGTLRSPLAVLMFTLALWPATGAADGVGAVFLSLDGDWDEAFSTALCESLAEGVGLSHSYDAPTPCVRERTGDGAQALVHARASRNYALHVQVRQRGTDLELNLNPWGRPPSPSTVRLSWEIRHGSPAEELEQVRLRLGPSLSRLAADSGISDLVPLRALVGSGAANPPDYLSAGLEAVGILAIGEVWYLTDTSISKVDWKYDVSWTTVREKLVTGRGIQFDDNVLYLNSPGHPAAGAIYYESARMNGLGMFASFCAGVLSTFAWEYLVEFREVASINDMVMTPVGGLALGEPLNEISDFFRRSEPTPLNRVLSGLFSFPSGLNPARNASAPGGLRLLDSRGLSADKWHRFALTAGFDVVHAEGAYLSALGGSAGLEAQLLGDELLGRPGASSQLSAGPLATRTHLGATFSGRGLQDLVILGETVYAGLWVQDLKGTDAAVRGPTALLGLGALFEHEERFAPGLIDQMGLVAIAGPTAQGTLDLGELHLRTGADLYPVFGAMFSEAWPSLLANPDVTDRPSAVLVAQGYYWAYGLRASARLALEFRNGALGAEWRRIEVQSAERALGREPVADLPLDDRRQTFSFWVGHRTPLPDVWLRATFEHTRRWSEAGKLSATRDDSRFHLTLRWEI